MNKTYLILWCLLAFPVWTQESSDALIQRGQLLEEKGDLGGAITLFSQAIATGKQLKLGYLARGLAHQKLGEWVEAERDFTLTLKEDNHHVHALVHRAMVRWDQKKWDDVTTDLKQVLVTQPNHPKALFLSGLTHYRKGQWDQVIVVATRGLVGASHHPGLTCLRGMAHLKKQNPTAAWADLRRASQLASNYPAAVWGLSQVYAVLNNPLQAEHHWQMACAMNSAICQKKPGLVEEAQWIRQDVDGTYPGYCICCRLFNQDNRHDEAAVLAFLASRKKLQEKDRHKLKAFNDFQFEDRFFESGLDSGNQVVDDSARAWKPVHYDHGNGLAVADVDGDGYLDLYFTTQLGSNGLWRSRGDGTYEDITVMAGVGLIDKISVTASFADVDNDGDPDLFVTTVRKGNYFFENIGKGHFRDITKQAGLTYTGHSSAPVFFDVDNDGRLDLLLTNVGVYTNDEKQPVGNFVGLVDAFAGHLKPERFEKSLLYRNEGQLKFRDVTEAMGFQDIGFAGDASIVDINNDGFQDIYILNMQGDDQLYINQAGKRLVEKTAEYFPKTPWGSMGIKFLDYNNNGQPDLYITDMHSDMSANAYPHQEKEKSAMAWSDEFLQDGTNNIFGNAFYHNSGKKPLQEVSDEIGVENYWPWGLSAGDLNADGYLDLFVTASMNYPFRYGVNSLFLNDGGTRFWDAEFLLGVEPRQQTVKPWFSVDCDGVDTNHQVCKDRKGRQLVWGAFGSRSSVILDVDEDGDLDIVTNEFNAHPQVLISNLTKKKKVHFIKIDLEGIISNRNGIGAKVEVIANGKTYTQYRDGKSGYLSQSVMPLYFGLDDATEIERIEILWPSGIHQVIVDHLQINQRLKIKEETAKGK